MIAAKVHKVRKEAQVRRLVGAVVRAASPKQLAIAVLVVFCGLMLLFDSAVGGSRDEPAARPQHQVEHTDPPPPQLFDAIFEDPAFVRFIGFCMISFGLLIGTLVVFWRLGREQP